MADKFSVPLYLSKESFHYIQYHYGNPAELPKVNRLTDVIKNHLRPQPKRAEHFSKKEGCEIVVNLPWFSDKDPRIYNYLYPKTNDLIDYYIYESMLMLDFINYMIKNYTPGHKRIDLYIYAFIEINKLEDIVDFGTLKRRWYRLREKPV